MLEQKTSIEVGANQSSTQRVRPMPPCECADKISSTASAEFSDSKVHNVVTQSSASVASLPHVQDFLLQRFYHLRYDSGNRWEVLVGLS
jgi:hypothetical protein